MRRTAATQPSGFRSAATGSERARRILRARDVELMLASTIHAPFDDDAWTFEPKLDGFRLRAAKEHGGPVLLYRRGMDVTSRYPELAAALASLPYRHLVLDGELVVLGPDGRPRFDLLSQRARRGARGALTHPVQFCAFDALALEGEDLRARPLRDRRDVLSGLGLGPPHLAPVLSVEGIGTRFLEQVRALRLEGLVAKRLASQYRGGRSSDWRKLCLYSSAVFAAVGVTLDGSAVALAARSSDGMLRFVGLCDWGWSAAQAVAAAPLLAARRIRTAPCADGPGRGIAWLAPALTCRVRYKNWFPSGLREPIFQGFVRGGQLADVVETAAAE